MIGPVFGSWWGYLNLKPKKWKKNVSWFILLLSVSNQICLVCFFFPSLLFLFLFFLFPSFFFSFQNSQITVKSAKSNMHMLRFGWKLFNYLHHPHPFYVPGFVFCHPLSSYSPTLWTICTCTCTCAYALAHHAAFNHMESAKCKMHNPQPTVHCGNSKCGKSASICTCTCTSTHALARHAACNHMESAKCKMHNPQPTVHRGNSKRSKSAQFQLKLSWRQWSPIKLQKAG